MRFGQRIFWEWRGLVNKNSGSDVVWSTKILGVTRFDQQKFWEWRGLINKNSGSDAVWSTKILGVTRFGQQKLWEWCGLKCKQVLCDAVFENHITNLRFSFFSQIIKTAKAYQKSVNSGIEIISQIVMRFENSTSQVGLFLIHSAFRHPKFPGPKMHGSFFQKEFVMRNSQTTSLCPPQLKTSSLHGFESFCNLLQGTPFSIGPECHPAICLCQCKTAPWAKRSSSGSKSAGVQSCCWRPFAPASGRVLGVKQNKIGIGMIWKNIPMQAFCLEGAFFPTFFSKSPIARSAHNSTASPVTVWTGKLMVMAVKGGMMRLWLSWWFTS